MFSVLFLVRVASKSHYTLRELLHHPLNLAAARHHTRISALQGSSQRYNERSLNTVATEWFLIKRTKILLLLCFRFNNWCLAGKNRVTFQPIGLSWLAKKEIGGFLWCATQMIPTQSPKLNNKVFLSVRFTVRNSDLSIFSY